MLLETNSSQAELKSQSYHDSEEIPRRKQPYLVNKTARPTSSNTEETPSDFCIAPALMRVSVTAAWACNTACCVLKLNDCTSSTCFNRTSAIADIHSELRG